jgi:hypothetical protein
VERRGIGAASSVGTLDLVAGEPSLTIGAPSGTGGGSTENVCATNDDLQVDPSFSQPLWPYPRMWTRVP